MALWLFSHLNPGSLKLSRFTPGMRVSLHRNDLTDVRTTTSAAASLLHFEATPYGPQASFLFNLYYLLRVTDGTEAS